jgi:hypothetical protein
MKIKYTLSIYVTLLIMATTAYGQAINSATDYLSVPGPITFDKTTYNLIWTSHPSDNFYTQEYIPAGDTVEKFKTMVLIDVTRDVKIKDLVANMISRIEKLKKDNPVVHYEVFENKGEYMLDFLLSENTPDGKYVHFVERNVYHYKTITDAAGQKEVLLFGISTRSYWDDVTPFLASLKSNRDDLINKVGQYDTPKIMITK